MKNSVFHHPMFDRENFSTLFNLRAISPACSIRVMGYKTSFRAA